MVYAALAQCPVIGGTVKSFDGTQAKSMPGVQAVVQISNEYGGGVAVVADSWWRANQARKTLKIEWDEGPGARLSNASMLEGIRAASTSPASKVLELKKVGDADGVIAASGNVVRREYVSQLLSHAPLEPMNFTAHYNKGKVSLI
ncbi:hypothetical protein ACQV5M_22025, partial [Leptospira sp. SA-E8]